MLLVLMCIQPRVVHFVCLSCLVLHVVCAVLPEFEFKTFRDDVVLTILFPALHYMLHCIVKL